MGCTSPPGPSSRSLSAQTQPSPVCGQRQILTCFLETPTAMLTLLLSATQMIRQQQPGAGAEHRPPACRGPAPTCRQTSTLLEGQPLLFTLGGGGFTLLSAQCKHLSTVLTTPWRLASTRPTAQTGKPRLTTAGVFPKASPLGSCGPGAQMQWGPCSGGFVRTGQGAPSGRKAPECPFPAPEADASFHLPTQPSGWQRRPRRTAQTSADQVKFCPLEEVT